MEHTSDEGLGGVKRSRTAFQLPPSVTYNKKAGVYPIVWTDVLTPYGTDALADTPLAVFGSLQFWWMGEHGHPRMDTSDHVFFANDQLAVRFIEEIDFGYVASDATAVLLTAAA